MGTSVEFNSILALRENGTTGFSTSEVIPLNPTPGVSYTFIKKGQRVYPIESPIPLLVTKGNCQLVRLVGFVEIYSYTVGIGEEYPTTTGGFYKFIRAASTIESAFYLNLFSPNDAVK
jgi:hypothetical protein